MRHTRLVYAVAFLVLGTAVVAGGQTARPNPLPDALRAHVKGEYFDVVTSVRGLPLGLRNELQTMWRSSTLDIAEPGAPFQSGPGPADPALPTRRMVAAGCSADFHCLLYYERGGRSRTALVALFRWTPAATRLEWGGTAPAGLITIDDVRGAVLSGAIGATEAW